MTQWIDSILQWVDSNDIQWGLSTYLTQVWTDDNYVYASTSEGLDVYDIYSENRYAYITYSGGLNTVWGNDDKVFVGTSDAGVKYINKTCISGSIIEAYKLENCLLDLSSLTAYNDLGTPYIKYIHGNNDILLIVTNSGVSVIKLDPQSYRNYTLNTDVYKGFMTSTGKFYYTVSGTGWSIHRMNVYMGDWTIPEYEYVTGSGILASGIVINDLFVTEGTSSDGVSNTLFIATTSGAYVIDEGTSEYGIYYKE